MQKSQDKNSGMTGIVGGLAATLGRILISFFVPVITFLVLWQVFIFLRDSNAPQIVIVLVAIIWGVAGVALLYIVSNWFVEQLPDPWPRRLQPFVYVGPAVVIMGWYLAVPVLRTLVLSFKDDIGVKWVGFDNYIFAFTDRIMLETFRNNLLWMIVGTSFSVGLGLLIAVLADRSRFESVYKAIIFMPMAISFVGAGVIWKFVYTYKGEGVGIQEIGLLNAIVLALGGQSQPWLSLPPWNNLFLIVIMVWLQTGFAMVIISSAIKGIPAGIAGSRPHRWRHRSSGILQDHHSLHQRTLITVTTTIVIFSLKLFDIVRVMTGGNNGTNVIANEFYLAAFHLWKCRTRIRHRHRSADRGHPGHDQQSA